MEGRRISKEDYYLEIAKAVAQRSPCIRRQFGAVIVKDDSIVSTGYNGTARGVVNCNEVGCLKNKLNLPHYSGYDFCPAVHAEENAVVNAARHGSSVLGGKMFIFGQNFEDKSVVEARPCERCRRIIINAGIEKVIIRKEDGSIGIINVSDWVKEDTENYLKKLKESV
jgi:dCMP deaminase